MFYGNIKFFDIADGYGVRTSLFVSGCRNHCRGCFQPETWNFCYGKEFTRQTMEDIIESMEQDYVNGLTILGGDPMEPENMPTVLELIQEVRKRYGETKDIWLYTGYLYEDLVKTELAGSILLGVDVLVDGPFILEKRDPSLSFRGSSNQRLIDVRRTIHGNHIVVWENPEEFRRSSPRINTQENVQ